jgi:hypothetical protein
MDSPDGAGRHSIAADSTRGHKHLCESFSQHINASLGCCITAHGTPPQDKSEMTCITRCKQHLSELQKNWSFNACDRHHMQDGAGVSSYVCLYSLVQNAVSVYENIYPEHCVANEQTAETC